ncbi:MAG TPA: ATP-binding protein [Armatimonadetes bacterium]|nr:ATP-binding protein [Armatimonadota bacterium]
MSDERQELEAIREMLRQRLAAATGEELAVPELPPAPTTLEDTGLPEGFLHDLALKMLYARGHILGREWCQALHLPYPKVMERIIRFLKEEALCEVRRGTSTSELNWEFSITRKGQETARLAMERDGYVGPVPVPLEEYNARTRAQGASWEQMTMSSIREALKDLVVSDRLIWKLGPAFNSGRSMFLYGHAGNGKTLISERMCQSLRGAVVIPYAIEAGGQVIQFYDAAHHEPYPLPSAEEEEGETFKYDRRWLLVRRPFIIVGGELRLEHLNLNFDPNLRYYIAPAQMKANGGVFMVDDFGRQQIPPRDLLNRWIVPLEKRVDYHTLVSGVQVEVPFNVLIIFSTNLEPRDLVEEAFLRRIRYKIEIGDPSEEEFREIFRRCCEQFEIEFVPEMLDYLIEKHYRQAGRGFRATHPRDLLSQLIDIANFTEVEKRLTPELIDAACETYFVEL